MEMPVFPFVPDDPLLGVLPLLGVPPLLIVLPLLGVPMLLPFVVAPLPFLFRCGVEDKEAAVPTLLEDDDDEGTTSGLNRSIGRRYLVGVWTAYGRV
jgi:hypothetical protein